MVIDEAGNWQNTALLIVYIDVCVQPRHFIKPGQPCNCKEFTVNAARLPNNDRHRLICGDLAPRDPLRFPAGVQLIRKVGCSEARTWPSSG